MTRSKIDTSADSRERTREPDLLVVALTGDVHLSARYCAGREACEDIFDRPILDTLRQSHYVVLNVEGPITTAPPLVRHAFGISNDPRSVQLIKGLGGNILSLANNHVLDHGLQGLRDTIQVAKANGWSCLGAGENLKEASTPVVLTQGELRVGVLAVCSAGVQVAGLATPGVFGDVVEAEVRAAIAALRADCRWVVVVYHGGEEFTHVPMPARRRRLLQYLGYGADVVVAHHAHVVQRYEVIEGKHLFYGLGNLVFDHENQECFPGTDSSVVLSCRFTQESFELAPLFTRQDRQRRTVHMVPEDGDFRCIDNSSYAAEWGDEAQRMLALYWRKRHENLQPRLLNARFLWKKLLRAGALLLMLRKPNLRPIVLSGVFNLVRAPLRRRRRAGKFN